jgi:PhnB protein
MNTTTLQPYLLFNGRCDEALEFYKSALDAQVDFLMRFKESPEPLPPGMVPPGFENKVRHATFRIGGNTLMASDGNKEGASFEGISLYLTLPTEAGAKKVFAALADGGTVDMPLAKTFWSPCFGMVTDRFGVGWKIGIAA